MSKHHYAIELGKTGNKVFFVNHPDQRKKLKRGEVIIEETNSKNITSISHRLFHPYFLKFKANWLYNFLMRFHIRKIVKSVGSSPDIVWSFDTGNTLPLKYFPRTSLKILMPVDGPFGHIHERQSVEDADVIISVTSRIIKAFDHVSKPKLIVNHGVADVFLNRVNKNQGDGIIRVGYSGSLVRNDLDINCFLQIIQSHPDIVFEFWGEHDFKKSNIHLPEDVHASTLSFLEKLGSLPNVILHGPVSSEELANGLQRMDVLLICYTIKNDQNHHKVLEYLSTGVVIVSNFLSSYASEKQPLLEMTKNPENNSELPDIFNKVVNDLAYYNSCELREMRINFARQFSYASNIKRIENFINQAVENYS